MRKVNIHEAKTTLSQLVEAAEAGEKVILARAGNPVVQLVRLRQRKQGIKLGLLKGRVPERLLDTSRGRSRSARSTNCSAAVSNLEAPARHARPAVGAGRQPSPVRACARAARRCRQRVLGEQREHLGDRDQGPARQAQPRLAAGQDRGRDRRRGLSCACR